MYKFFFKMFSIPLADPGFPRPEGRQPLGLRQRPIITVHNEVAARYSLHKHVSRILSMGVSVSVHAEIHTPLPSACWDGHGYCCGWYAFLFAKIFAKNCLKMKEIEPRGGGAHVPNAPLRPSIT